jgi:hypothetical protein
VERRTPPPIGRLALPALRDMAESLPEIDHYELDGIPLFHMPAAGATILTLAFGVGRAHEPVHKGGLTHLAEHLILTAIDGALDHSNGTTEPYRVTFTIRGSPADATRFLRDVCDQIARPRVARMHEEANVLVTEAVGRSGSSIEGRLAVFRCGFQGLGTMELPELFLRRMEVRDFADWIAEHLVAGNAALWLSGPLPDDLYVSLESRGRTVLPQFREIDGFQGPSLVQADVGGVAASFVVDRSLAIQVALRTIEGQLRHALRVDRGLSYAITTNYRPVSSEQAHAYVFASCLPEKVAEVQRAMLETIDEVASRGSTDDQIGAYLEDFLRDGSDPMSFPARLDAHVRDNLMGRQTPAMAALVDELWRLQPDDVAVAFRAARETMLVLLPSNAIAPAFRSFKPYPAPANEPLGKGQSFDYSPPKGTKVERGKLPKLFVGERGLSIDTPAGRYAAITWRSDCIAVIQDGKVRTVLAKDGQAVVIDPQLWAVGSYAITLIDRYAPGHLVVP